MRAAKNSPLSLPNLFGFTDPITIKKGTHRFSIGKLMFLKDEPAKVLDSTLAIHEDHIYLIYTFMAVGLSQEDFSANGLTGAVVNEAVAQVIMHSSLPMCLYLDKGVDYIGDAGARMEPMAIDEEIVLTADMVLINALPHVDHPVSGHMIDVSYTAQWWNTLDPCDKSDVWRRLKCREVCTLLRDDSSNIEALQKRAQDIMHPKKLRSIIKE